MSTPRDTPAGDSKPKVWTVGTLTYTSTGLVILFFWLLLGDFAWSMRDRSVGPAAGWFLDHLGVPNIVFGILVSSFPAVVALLIGPVISVMSDRHRGRWGRRIPFLMITTPIAAVGILGLAITPMMAKYVHSHMPEQSEWVVAVMCFGVFWAAFELATIAGQAVLGGLINDVVPRELLGRFYGLFRAVSLIDGMIFNYWIMGLVPDYFSLILLLVAVFYGSAFMWVCMKVKEGDYPPPEPLPAHRGGWFSRIVTEIKVYCRECFARPYYLLVFLLMMFAGLTFSPVNVFSIPHARSLGVDMDAYGKSLALTYFISLCLSYFLGWLADIFHPLRMAMVTLLGYALVTLYGSLYAVTPHTFLVVWVLHGVLAGSYFSGAASLAQRLFPHEKFAQFASGASIFMAVGNIALAPIVGTMIDSTGGEYRTTFTVASGLAFTALAISWLVYRKFLQLGGPKNYTAPE